MKRRKQQKSQATKAPASGAYPPLPFAELPQHNSYALLFLINVIVGLVWQQIFPIFGSVDYLVGFVIGFFAIWFSNRTYGRRAYDLAYFIGFILWEILLSNFMLAKLVIQPKPKLDPGIVAVPLTVSTELEIMMLASLITLTPGTISVDLGENAQRERVLYIHNLTLGDPEEFRMSVKNTFERLLLRVTRGRDA